MRSFCLTLATLIAALSMASGAWAAPMNFLCAESRCVCNGTADCRDLRKSGMCDGVLSCTGSPVHCMCVYEKTNPSAGAVRPPNGGIKNAPAR
jgi:hypothetical protein